MSKCRRPKRNTSYQRRMCWLTDSETICAVLLLNTRLCTSFRSTHGLRNSQKSGVFGPWEPSHSGLLQNTEKQATNSLEQCGQLVV